MTGLNVDIRDSVLAPCHYMFRSGQFMGETCVTTCDRSWQVLVPFGHLCPLLERRRLILSNSLLGTRVGPAINLPIGCLIG